MSDTPRVDVVVGQQPHRFAGREAGGEYEWRHWFVMIHVSNDPIPANKLGQFHEVLCACGGRYRGNPRDCTKHEGVYRVDYSYDPTTGFDARLRRCIEDVREVRRDQWWRRLLRRLANTSGQPRLAQGDKQ